MKEDEVGLLGCIDVFGDALEMVRRNGQFSTC